jgi:heat shock protein HslJ
VAVVPERSLVLQSCSRYVAAAVAASFFSAACATGNVTAPTDEVTANVSNDVVTLVGPTWRLASLEGHELVPETHVTAVFASDDRVTGSAGCNSYFGSAAATGGRLAVGPLASTRMYCGAKVIMDQEQAYLTALQAATVYSLAGGELRLGPAKGVVTLVYRPE